MSGLIYAVNVNYVTGGGGGADLEHGGSVDNAKSNASKVDDSKANAPKATSTPLEPNPPKPPHEPKPIIEVLKVKSEPEASKVKIKDEDAKEGLEGSCSIDSRTLSKVKSKDEDAKEGLEGSCSIDSRPLSEGFESDFETDSINEDGIENYRGIDGEERIRIIKDLNSGDRIVYFTEKELERAKRRRLRRREQSDPPEGPIGSIFKEHGKWMEKCTVHGRVSMEVEHLIDVNKELQDYIRPGGPYKLTRHAIVDENIPVCADYADWYHDPELRYVKDYDIKGYRKRRIQRWLSEVSSIHEGERFDRYLVRCHAEALKELTLMNQEYKEYQNMFPHIVDKWVAVLHFGMLLKRKNMGKSCDVNESELIIKLLREQCEMLYFKTKIIFFEGSNERRDHNVVPKQHWILHPKHLCGDCSI